jgi:DNA-binding FrmR family transcriptional regulator
VDASTSTSTADDGTTAIGEPAAASHPTAVGEPTAGIAGDDGAGAHPHAHGYSAERDAYLKRLRRIEGQIRGLQRMVGEDAYCIDILTQISAATRALQGVALALLDEHIRHCVADAVAGGGPGADASITEAMRAIERLVKA